MNKRIFTLALAALLLGSTASAQYAGPSAVPLFRSIQEVLRSGNDNARVELEGYIVKQVGKEKYLFSDGRDQIRIEIEAEDFPNVRIDEKTRVRIRGEVEKDFLESPEIDVDRLTVL